MRSFTKRLREALFPGRRSSPMPEHVYSDPRGSLSVGKLGDVPKLSLREVEDGDLSPEFRAALMQQLTLHRQIVAAWVIWMFSGSEGELFIQLEFEGDQEALFVSLLPRLASLEGPPCVASPIGRRPRAIPFYQRGSDSDGNR